ncbi:MAG: septal ring lytic transglycosylase RlpA family protein [Granulosicoccus sp.]
MKTSYFRVSVFMTIALVLTACTVLTPEPAWKKAVAGDGPGNPALLEAEVVKVSNLPKSRTGNRSEYEVFGVRYAVLESAHDFREQGVASWYGSKFHGNATASGEIYDMHQLTAAHKHLPLPTFVRVTRVDNGHSIVVKVNDRGPFVGDRIIDLSYAAAAKLDMLDSGKAEVLVEALSHHEPSENGFAKAADAIESTTIQVGAFSERSNADALMQKVSGDTQLPLYLDFEMAQQIYRVLIGPLQDERAVDVAVRRLKLAGISDFQVNNTVR